MGFKDILDSLPRPKGPLWKSEVFVELETGLAITQLSSTSLLQPGPLKFRGTINVSQTNGQQVTLVFEIPASTIQEAAEGWNAAARKALTDFDEQMQKNSKRIFIPPGPLAGGKLHA